MDKKKFYDVVRPHVNLTTQNVLGMDKVLDYLEAQEDNIQQAAYIIATAWWETAQTMMPVREAYWLSESWRKKNLRYYPFYGRGYVQLTWDYNYKKASDYFGVDFVNDPDLVMEPEHALPILVVGMNKGWFTGKDLDDYIDETDAPDSEEFKEYKNARRIVNGTDRATAIANLALVFEKGLKASGYKINSKAPNKPVDKPKPIPAPTQPEKPKAPVQPRMGILGLILSILKKLFGDK